MSLVKGHHSLVADQPASVSVQAGWQLGVNCLSKNEMEVQCGPRLRGQLLRMALIKVVASKVSGQHDTFLPGDLRATGPVISLSKSQEVVMSRAKKVHSGIHFQSSSSNVYICVLVFL